MILVPVSVAIFVRPSPEGRHQTWIQERTDGPLKGQWEFPGGKIEVGETPWDALVREIREETAVEVRGEGKLLGIYPVDYGEKRILLQVFVVPWQEALAQAKGKVVDLWPGCDGRGWNLPLLPANFALVEHLCRALYDEGHE